MALEATPMTTGWFSASPFASRRTRRAAMPVRVGINGFGRVGRSFLRAAKVAGAEIDIVAVNDLGSLDAVAQLLERDSMLGQLPQMVSRIDRGVSISGVVVDLFSERRPGAIPWGDLGVDVVIESTGALNSREQSAPHLDAGARHVIVSAPCAGADSTFIVGVNDDTFDGSIHKVMSNASPIANSFAPIVRVLDDAFGVRRGLMTAAHSLTGDRSMVGGPPRPPRGTQGVSINIVPTSTGAARWTGLVLQSTEYKLGEVVPWVRQPNGSLTDFTAVIDGEPSIDDVNAAFAAASTGRLAGVIDYAERPILRSDVVMSPASCIFDPAVTMTLGSVVKVAGRYDNEWGYANRLVDLALIVGAANK